MIFFYDVHSLQYQSATENQHRWLSLDMNQNNLTRDVQ